MLQSDQHWAEAIIVIAIAIITIEIEQTSSAAIPPIASTFEEWIVQAWEVRVVTVWSLIFQNSHTILYTIIDTI